MTSSKWHALGNVYLLVEQADRADAGRARELCATTPTACSRSHGSTSTVWNPDGSSPRCPATAPHRGGLASRADRSRA
jgi:hypothetical protein